MNTFFTSSATYGVSLWTILLTLFDCSSVFLFLTGCVYYCRIAKKAGNKASRALAVIGTAAAFTGGFPEAMDKFSRTFFSTAIGFDSSWMLFFIGVCYCLLFLSSLFLSKPQRSSGTCLSVVMPSFMVSAKPFSMLAAAIGMTGFHLTLYAKAKQVIGKKARLYLFPFLTLAILLVFLQIFDFSTVWPNLIAQMINSTGFVFYIIANRTYLAGLNAD